MKLLNLLIMFAVLWGILWAALSTEKTNSLVDYNTQQNTNYWELNFRQVKYIENNGDRCYVASGGSGAGVAITCKFN